MTGSPRTNPIWDRLGTLTPTRDAAVATSGVDGWEPKLQAFDRFWKTPPAMLTPVPKQALKTGLLGARFGRCTVIGILLEPGKKQPALWVCRCVCGDYTGFTAKALRNPAAPEHACPECRRTMRIQLLAAKPSTSKTRAKSAKALDHMVASIPMVRERQG